MSRSRNPPPRGQGAARAKQMGLLLDLTPDAGMDDDGNDEDLEAELLSLVGGGKGGRPQGKKGDGRSPVPMSEIERMAALCMKDLDDEDMGDEDLDDEDLLAELNEVLEDDEAATPAPTRPAVTPTVPKASVSSPSAPGGASGLESRLLERLDMYQKATANAKAAGETSKVRRYDRGLKTLQSMLTSVKKGKPINEEEIPPPVAIGAKSNGPAEPEPVKEREPPALIPSPPSNQKPLREPAPETLNTKPRHLTPPQKPAAAITPETPAISPLTPGQPDAHLAVLMSFLVFLPANFSNSELFACVSHFGFVCLPFSFSLPEFCFKSKPSMIFFFPFFPKQQYQDSIKAHSAGRPVNLNDLPVPPGCPPLQGSEGSQQNLIGVLETAMKIANQDADADDDDDDEDGQKEPAVRPPVQKAKSPAPPIPAGSSVPKLGPKAQQQVDFLLLRRQAFLRAALRSKQMKDMTGAAQHLRHAKGLEPMVTAAKSGLPVDITKIPSAPVSEEDYSLSRSRASPRSSEKYQALMDLLRKQHEVKTFSFKISLVSPLRSEKLVEETMKYIELLKNAHAKGHPVPKCLTQERTFNSAKINSNLSPSDLVLYIIRGINLPAPSGVSPNDLDASVKFEFPFPSSEDAQRDKTGTVKNSSSPEFKEQFRLNINRTHRGFKRVVQSKGIKFEVVHKGGLFKTDRAVGTAQLKLEALENHCEIREIIEVMDGRKATGGKLEVRVKIREPLSGVDLHPTTEKWFVLEPVSPLSPPEKQKERAPAPQSKPKHESSGRSSRPDGSPPQYKLHSFSLLNYDKERLERKIADYRKNHRDPPSDLIHQHKEVTHRLRWQKAQLERASPALLTEYEHVLLRFVQGLSESVKKYSSQGNREAAKDALGRMKMVESELESLKRKRTG
uniref:Coiled-coil and C2 domain-containing protein 1B n=1 Tax=Xiphophorus couchianus TaxID=32473 RepID=A0A3B5M4U8_9TELE